jgi:hypothetical protein
MLRRMWGLFARRRTKHSGAVELLLKGLGKARDSSGRRRTRFGRTTFGRTAGLAAGALALVATISLLLLLRRRARRDGAATEEANVDPRTEEAEGRPQPEGIGTEGHKEYFRKLIEETNKRSS